LRLNEAQRIAKIGSWERNLLTNEVWWSNEVYRLLELDPEKHAPSYKAFLQAVHIDDRAHVEETVASAARQGKPYSAHHRVVLANGDTRIFHDRAYVISDDQGKPVRLVGTLQDITEHAELERELVAVSENERDRIGRDLHDGLGQLLTGISLSLKTMAARLAEEHSRHTDLAQKLSATTQEAILETSRVARLLSPRISGLGAALERLASDLNSYPDVRCRIRCQADHDEHDPVIEAHLYRIAQEASSNALRHGKAMNVEMHYQCNGKSLRLEIVDDGVGISPLTSSLEGIGLRNMRYRARIICGILEVERRQEGGTRILCSCPCRSAAS
jgi:signal transduction histidine kinase